MRILNRKLLRDLWRLKWQMAAISLLVACGVSVAVMSFSTQKSLETAQREYYARTHFADVFATATRAPRALADELLRLDGVIAVDARAMKIGLMEVPGLLRPATARLIALPDDERRALNRLVLTAGRLPHSNRSDEAVALKTFLDAAHVALGERVAMIINGRRLTFTIVGAALSPEYVYVPSFGPMPDDAHSGVFWAPREAVERPAGLGGAFSAVSLALAPGASEPATLAAVDRLLARYGGMPSYGRADQMSSKFQQDRIDRLAVMAIVIPPVFLAVAAILVHLVLGRLVAAEREQIGLLKAFGYDDRAAAGVYIKMATIVGVVGAVAGGAAGLWLTQTMVAVFADYVRYPRLTTQFSWAAFGVSVALSLTAAVAGSLFAVRRASRLSPAVAMQPPTPMTFRRGVFERIGVTAALDAPTRMIARSIERFPWRATMTVTGLGVSLSLLIGSQFMFSSIDDIIEQAYYRARHWSDEVIFGEARDIHAVAEIARLPAVLRAEPFRTVSGHLRAHGREERIMAIGLDDDALLSVALTPDDQRIPSRGDGVVVSQALAGRLRIGAGDVVELAVSEGRYPRALVLVTAVARDYAGLTVYLSRNALNRLMAEGNLVSGADVVVASDLRRDFYRAVVKVPQVVNVGSRDDAVAMFRSAIAAALVTEMSFFLGFAGAIAFGIAYNVSRIALSERARDLATLRVLGFTSIECAYILCGELLLLALAATPLGIAGGFGLARMLVTSFTKQDFYVPFFITPQGLGLAFATYLGAVLVAIVLVGQRIWRFDLVAVLKTRE